LAADDTDRRLIDGLSGADPRIQSAAIANIAAAPGERVSDEVMAALVRCVGAAAKSVQLGAAKALAAIAGASDERAAAMLRAALRDPSPRMRWGAAFALSRIDGDAFGIDAVDAIAEALGNPDSDVRWSAAELLTRLGLRHPDEIRARLLELAGHGEPNVHRMALYCIRDLGCCGGDVIAAIERALADENRFVRLAAVSVLSRIDETGAEAARILNRCLESDTDAGVRGAAQSALAKLNRR